MDLEGAAYADHPGLDREDTSTFLFARPDRFVVRHSDREIYSDGRWIWVYHPTDGEELWAHVPEMAPDVSSEMTIAAGDLDGDGVSEIIVGTSLHRKREMGPSSYAIEPEGSVVTVLRVTGERVVQRRFPVEIQAVLTVAAPGADRATIVCLFANGKATFELAR